MWIVVPVDYPQGAADECGLPIDSVLNWLHEGIVEDGSLMAEFSSTLARSWSTVCGGASTNGKGADVITLPSKLTSEVAAALCAARRSGLSIGMCTEFAATSTGTVLSLSSVKAWLRKGNDDPTSAAGNLRVHFNQAYAGHIKDTVAALVAQLDDRSMYKFPPSPAPVDLEAQADELLASGEGRRGFPMDQTRGIFAD